MGEPSPYMSSFPLPQFLCPPTYLASQQQHLFVRMLTHFLVFTDDEGNESSRPLGLVVARGTLLVVISPVDGSEEIENPFAQPEEA